MLALIVVCLGLVATNEYRIVELSRSLRDVHIVRNRIYNDFMEICILQIPGYD